MSKMSNEITRSQVKNFLTWYEKIKEESPFKKRALWEIQKECWNHKMEHYWHYEDKFSSDQVERILDGGLDAYNEICFEIEECYFEESQYMKKKFISQIDIHEDDLTDKFKEAIKLNDNEEDNIVDKCRDALNDFILENFEDELNVYFVFEDLLKRTTGEIYIDCEDFCRYDLVDINELNAENLMFTTTDRELTDAEEDMLSEELGVRMIEDLDEVHEFSVCIADSLDDYLNMLVEAANKNTTGKPVELYFMAKVGSKLFDISRDSLYINTKPNFDSDNSSVYFMDEDTFKKTPCSAYESYDKFKNELNKHIYEYAKKYFLANLNKLDKIDRYGRTLVHYALYLNMLGKIEQYIWEQDKQYLYYVEDDNQVSPLAIAIAMSEDDSSPSETKENVDLFIKAAYSKLLSQLPRKNETSSSWETTSSMLGSIEGEDHYVIESNLQEYLLDENLDEYGLDSKVICLNVVDNTFKTMSLDSFTDLFPLEKPVKVCLDGTIAT